MRDDAHTMTAQVRHGGDLLLHPLNELLRKIGAAGGVRISVFKAG
jgi:hypothetical protein